MSSGNCKGLCGGEVRYAVVDAQILTELLGSDHCPILLELDLDALGRA